MGLVVDDKEADPMKKWAAIVEKYNETDLGARSPYKIKEVREDGDGCTILVLEPK